MVKLNWDEIDELGERKMGFGIGVYEVTIKDIDLEENANGKPYFKVTVAGENGEETDRIKMYLTEKAVPWTMATIQGIMVHNAKSDLAKDKVKKYLRTLEEADDLDPAKVVGAKAWLKVTQTDQEFTRDDGTTGYYNDFQLTSYKPKQNAEELVTEMMASGTPVEVEDVPFK